MFSNRSLGWQELDGSNGEGVGCHDGAEGLDHETVHASGLLVYALVDLLEALVHVLEALADLVEAPLHLREVLVHLRRDALNQLALALEVLFDPHHPRAQLDLVHRRRLGEGLLGEPLGQVVFDEPDVFAGEGHGIAVNGLARGQYSNACRSSSRGQGSLKGFQQGRVLVGRADGDAQAVG